VVVGQPVRLDLDLLCTQDASSDGSELVALQYIKPLSTVITTSENSETEWKNKALYEKVYSKCSLIDLSRCIPNSCLLNATTLGHSGVQYMDAFVNNYP
jgi:hypothetical protein